MSREAVDFTPPEPGKIVRGVHIGNACTEAAHVLAQLLYDREVDENPEKRAQLEKRLAGYREELAELGIGQNNEEPENAHVSGRETAARILYPHLSGPIVSAWEAQRIYWEFGYLPSHFRVNGLRKTDPDLHNPPPETDIFEQMQHTLRSVYNEFFGPEEIEQYTKLAQPFNAAKNETLNMIQNIPYRVTPTRFK
ncbi:MAG TPA: hypothetical protein VLF68_05180 [Candidatus Saccharimonadales bacterium]|nr:hypothetical protein [Candidatus Saccharimonadales bacterium]